MEHLGGLTNEANPGGDPLVLRVGSHGRVTLPHQVMTSLGWKPGDTLILTLDEEGHLTAQKQL